jgi:hypothetical protein
VALTKKRMLADVLWGAANERLSSGDHDRTGHTWSCHALYAAMYGDDWRFPEEADAFVTSLGCVPDESHFSEYRGGADRQGARYMWLLLAMHVAEDEGIEI